LKTDLVIKRFQSLINRLYNICLILNHIYEFYIVLAARRHA